VSNPESQSAASAKAKLSLDTWAVIVALAAALLVRLGLVHIPW
jgi:hypothetical protein